MATDYVTIGHIESGGSIIDGKRLDVTEWEPDIETPVEAIEATLDGARGISFGISKRVWRFTALVRYANPPSGYASMNDVRGWFTDNTIAGNQFKFQDLESPAIYNVILANKGEFRPKTSAGAPYSAGAIWEVPFVLMEI